MCVSTQAVKNRPIAQQLVSNCKVRDETMPGQLLIKHKTKISADNTYVQVFLPIYNIHYEFGGIQSSLSLSQIKINDNINQLIRFSSRVEVLHL